MDVELTDEDIRVELSKLPADKPYLPSAYEETSIAWNEFVAKAQVKKFVEYLDGFKCDECETPDFISLVLPKRIWQELNNIGGRL